MSTIPYSSAVDSLMYTMVCTRLDIAHSVGVVSRYLSNPGKVHCDAESGSLGTCVAPLNFVCVMGVENLFLRGIQMQTGLVISIIETLPQAMCSLFQGEPYHGNPSYKSVWLCRLSRQNI